MIYSIPITLVNKIYSAFDNNYFSGLIATNREVGKEADTHFIINTNVLLHNPNRLEHISIYNMFMQIAHNKCTMLQILKNQ